MKVVGLVASCAIAGVLAGCGARSEQAVEAAASAKATAQAVAAAEAGAPAGVYRRSSPAAGELTLARAGTGWRVMIDAASPPDGAGTAADCQMAAEGSLVDGRMVATAAPFDNDIISVSARELAAEAAAGKVRKAVIEVSGSVVNVVEADPGDYCGLGADLTGTYAR